MQGWKTNSLIKYCCIIIALGLLAYSGIRSYNLSFTHDESLSYNHMVHHRFADIMTNNTGYISANNHILNTLSMKSAESAFGNSEFALRLQSLLAHILYLLFTFLLLKDTRNNIIILCGFILLNVNPYLLDFFSLARGYAMAISFMLMSIYFFLSFVKTQKGFWLSLVTGCLAILSNFALITYMGALFVVYECYLLYTYPLKTHFLTLLRRNIPVVLTIAVMAFICYKPILALLKADQLYFGGQIGFWHDTVTTSIHSFLYGREYENTVFTILQAAIIVTIAGFVVSVLYKILTKRSKEIDSTGLLLLALLLVIVSTTLIEHVLVHTKFLEERFALFIVPLFVLVVVYFFSHLTSLSKILRMPAMVVIAVLSLGMSYHAYRSMNSTYTYNWKYDAGTKAMLADLQKEINTDNKTRLGITWYYEPAINFYRKTKKLDWLQEVDRSGAAGNFDCYYVAKEDPDYSKLGDKKVIKEYGIPISVLLKN
jgi:uncharacterized membrane protein